MALWAGKQPKQSCPTLQLLTAQVLQGLGSVYSGAQGVLGMLPGPPGSLLPGRPGKLPSTGSLLPGKPKLTLPGLG